MLVAAVLVALGVAGWFGVQMLTGGDPDPGDADAAAGADGSETIFGETQELVDDINRSAPGVSEALGELGLDPTGESLDAAGASPGGPDGITPLASYSFRWSDPYGLSVAVQVDSATGDFVATTNDGTEIRHVGDRYFGLAPNSGWLELSPGVVSGVPVVGIDGLLSNDGVLPAGIDQYVVASEATEDGRVRLLVDDAELARADPDLRASWLGPWGLLDAAAPVADAAPTDAVPTEAGEGQIVVSLLISADGWLSEVTVSSPAIGGTATYELSSTAMFPFPVEIPADLGGG